VADGAVLVAAVAGEALRAGRGSVVVAVVAPVLPAPE
jgi:hypothetical protein